MPRDIDLSLGQPLQSNQSSGSLGVIGRRSVSDLGAIGDTLGGQSLNSAGMHDQLYNLQMLESAYYKLPQPKDSERAKSYIPVRDYNYYIHSLSIYFKFYVNLLCVYMYVCFLEFTEAPCCYSLQLSSSSGPYC